MASKVAKVGLFKELWHKFPEVVGAFALGGLGCVFIGSVLTYRTYTDTHGIYRQHKRWYTVKRPNDVKDPDSELYN